jgi:3-phosphoshikimate 1-carboxyvinyltransferase
MNLRVRPGKPLRGVVNLPGDKSLSHRAVIFASLSDGDSQIGNFLNAGVTQVMLEAMRSFGIEWQLNNSNLIVHGKGCTGLKQPEKTIDCGNSATTMRLLAGFLAATNRCAILDGSDSLRKRPMNRIVEPLEKMGVSIHTCEGHAPLTIKGSINALEGIDYQLPVASAQVKSCLLLAGLAAKTATILWEPQLSRDHTERMLVSMGIPVETKIVRQDNQQWYQIKLEPGMLGQIKPLQIVIPGDISSAAFLIVATLITPGSELTIKNVGINPTRTGLLDALLNMGADIRIRKKPAQAGEPVGDIIVRHSALRGMKISGRMVVRMIDEFPIFSVAAAYAEGQSSITEAKELRYKESDRIASICSNLSKLGVDIRENENGYTINPGRKIRGGSIAYQTDHRLAMALAISGLAAEKDVLIEGSEIVTESYPDFVSTLAGIGAQVDIF